MTRRTVLLISLIIIIGIFMFLDGVRTAAAPKLVKFEGETMGTVWHVTVVSDGENPIATDARYAEIQAGIEEALKGVDCRMSTWKEFSELSRINAQKSATEDIPLSSEMAFVLARALEISAKTGGAYDVTVGPLVNLWKFGPTRNNAEIPEIPDDVDIASAREFIGWEALELLKDGEKTALRRKKEGLQIDLSSIAKGYGVDCVFEALRKFGFTNFMVEVGGEVRSLGVNHMAKPWRIGIELPKPGAEKIFGAVELTDCALATSGDYRNFKLDDGKRRSHIIDPRTGKPVEHALVSVSVLATDCMTADGWATALMVLGPEEGRKIATAEGLKVLFLVQDGETIKPVSVGFECEENPYLRENK